MKKPKTKSINIRKVDPELHAKFKALCAHRDKPMRLLIIKMIDDLIKDDLDFHKRLYEKTTSQ